MYSPWQSVNGIAYLLCSVYIPCIYALNKIDQLTLEELDVIDKIPHYVPISAHLEWNLDGLLEKMWEYLSLTRMYLTPDLKRIEPATHHCARRTVTRSLEDRFLTTRHLSSSVVTLALWKTSVTGFTRACSLSSNSAHHPSSTTAQCTSSLILLFRCNSALVWGSSVKHNPQRVGKEHVLNDEDVIQIVKRL